MSLRKIKEGIGRAQSGRCQPVALTDFAPLTTLEPRRISICGEIIIPPYC